MCVNIFLATANQASKNWAFMYFNFSFEFIYWYKYFEIQQLIKAMSTLKFKSFYFSIFKIVHKYLKENLSHEVYNFIYIFFSVLHHNVQQFLFQVIAKIKTKQWIPYPLTLLAPLSKCDFVLFFICCHYIAL